jgi:hypothetical protein
MAEEIAALRVAMSVDTAEFERGMKQAEAGIAAFGARLARFAGAISGFVTAALAATGVVAAFNAGLKEITKFDAAAAALGLTSQAMRTLAEAAGQSGVTLAQLQTAAAELATNLNTGLRTPMSDVSLALRVLEVDARNADGSVRTFTQLMPDLANAFARFADGTNKTTIAVALFGQEVGPGMARFLSQGITKIEEKRTALERILPKYDTKPIREFEAAQGRLGATLSRLATQLNTEVAQALAGPAAAALDAINKGLGLSERVAARAAENVQLTREQNRLIQERLDLQKALEDASARMTATTGDADAFAKADEDFKAALSSIDRVDAALARVRDRLREINLAGGLDAVGPKPGPGPGPGGIGSDAVAARDQIARPPVPDPNALREELREAEAQLEAMQMRLSGQDPGQGLLGRFLYGDSEPFAITDGFASAMAQVDKIAALSGQNATRTANIKKQLALQEQQQLLDTASLAASTLTSVFAGNKAAGIAAAVINTAVGITKAIALGGPFGWAQAALVAAAGAAQIATIRSSNPGTGNVPSVGGGGAGGEPPQPNQMLTINLQGSRFTKEEVRALMAQVNEAIQDGATLITTQ